MVNKFSDFRNMIKPFRYQILQMDVWFVFYDVFSHELFDEMYVENRWQAFGEFSDDKHCIMELCA